MHNNNTIKMLEHLKKEWVRDDIRIVPPKAYRTKENIKTIPKEWNSISRDDMEVVKYQEHELAIEWEVIIHKVFKLGVVLNQHGYHIQQLFYEPESLK